MFYDFFSVFQKSKLFKILKDSSFKLVTHYVFKCRLSYLAMFKLFQHNIFACLTNELTAT